MANILTPAEAAQFIRSTADDAVLLMFQPLVDAYLKNASGHDWTTDSTKHPTAKTAAGMLLTYWYDNPSMVGQAPASLSAALVQLEIEALKYRKYEFAGLESAGAISLDSARKGDEVILLVGTYGVTGDQTESFEAVVSEDGQIEQTDEDDLSDNLYVVVLKHPADDVSA
jgi:hypothetical protein